MTTMMNMLAQGTEFPHLHHLFSAVDVEAQSVQFAFQEDALTNSLDLDDADAANDINEFAQLLSAVEDEETANDIDAFTDLIESLSKAQSKDELSDMSNLLPVPSFSANDLDLLLGKNEDVEMESNDVSDDDDSDVDDDEDVSTPSPLDSAVALSPFDFRSYQPPIDPRCCIKTAIFNQLDPRIPMAFIPRMDVTFGNRLPAPAAPVVPMANVATAPLSPKSSASVVADMVDEEVYVHDPARCWVCKSGKSEARKAVLHRFVEKRYRRNWKRGARYTARSRVASSRVREGGRFVTKCQWFAPSYE